MLASVIPDVYRLGGRGVNFYLCVEKDGLTLIDSGMPKNERVVWKAISELGGERSDLKRILITHADMDHAGSAAAIQAETGAKIFAGAETAVWLRSGKAPKHMPWPVQFIMDYFVRFTAVPAEAIEQFQDGDILPLMDGLQVVATPGHTLDHHSFYCPGRGILFAGDALNTRDGRLQSTPKRATADEEAARISAIRLIELAPAVIACGHGLPSGNHNSDGLMQLFNQLRQEV